MAQSHKIIAAKYYRRHKKTILAKVRKWQIKNREKYRLAQKKYSKNYRRKNAEILTLKAISANRKKQEELIKWYKDIKKANKSN